MGSVGDDPSEYLPRDTRAAPATDTNTLNDSRASSAMNAPAGLAMYERQSPNPVNHHSVTANENMYSQYHHQQSSGFSYQDNNAYNHDSNQRFLANGEAGVGLDDSSYLTSPPPHPYAPPTSSSHLDPNLHNLHDGYQGLSFVEREPPETEPKEQPYEPLYMHNRGDGGPGYDGPSQGYSDPSQGYNDPSQGYNDPSQGYNDPSQGYNDPSQGYNDPSQGFNDPSQGYNDPSQGYNDPNQGYTNPSQGYNDPRQGYNDPSQSYDGPDQSYGGPNQSGYDGPNDSGNDGPNESGYNGPNQSGYDGPNQSGFGDPSLGYNDPGQGFFSDPTQGYSDPNPGYNDPNQVHRDPAQGFNDPNQGYNDPDQGYNDPNQGYNDPNQGYNDPNQGYNDPNQGYSDPPPVHSDAGPGYDGPAQGYPGPGTQAADGNQEGLDSFDQQFQYRDESQLESSYAPGGEGGNYAEHHTLPNYAQGAVGEVTERFQQMSTADADRYSDRGAPPPHRHDDSFHGQGSGYYDAGQQEDPYGNRQELMGGAYNPSPQPSPRLPDNRSQSPASDPRGPPYSSNSRLNGPVDAQGSQSRLQYGEYGSQSHIAAAAGQGEAGYGMGREDYERQESLQYSRQGSQRNLAGSQTHMHQAAADLSHEPPLAQGSQDHLAYMGGSQSQLNRSLEGRGSQVRLAAGQDGSLRGSQVRLAAVQTAGQEGSLRGSQMHLQTSTMAVSAAYTAHAQYDDNESEIPRQDSIILQQGGYNMEVLRKAESLPGERRWRDPDLQEVIQYLSHPNPNINANAAAYLQHLCFMDDSTKSRTREYGGIPALVALVRSDIPEVQRAACGALRNLSYGRANDENKKAIKNAGGIPALFTLLSKSPDNDVKELVTGILWNLSSLPELKKHILEARQLEELVTHVLLPHSQMDRYAPSLPPRDAVVWSTVFRNASGVLRNVSSDGADARKKLRDTPNLVDCTLYLLRAAIGQSDIDNKSVENCVCMLRNLSFACQEVQDPLYLTKREKQLKQQAKGEATGCFGQKSSKKTKQEKAGVYHPPVQPYISSTKPGEPVRGKEKLWEPEVVSVYLPLLSDCTNPETLEAAAGAIQNLAACDWQPSVSIRAQVRKEKALPILVELLNLEADRVVCASATALRNLAIDPKNNELIGKYAMKQLVSKLPWERRDPNEYVVSDETVCAVEATIYEVIKSNEEHARTLLAEGGCERLMYIMNSRQKYSPKVVKFASTILYTMWQYKDMHAEYKKRSWTQTNFISKTMAAKAQHVPPGQPLPASQPNTLQRPSMGQSGPTAAGYNENTMAHVTRAGGERPYMGERTPQLNHRDGGGSMHRLPPDDLTMKPANGSVHNLATQQQYPGSHYDAGYYDSLQQTGAPPPQDGYDGRQNSYRPASQLGGYEPDRQNSYMHSAPGSERGGGGGGYESGRQDSYKGQDSYRQAPSEQGGPYDHRQDSYRQDQGGYRQDSYRAPPSEQGAYNPQDSYRQGPPSEHGSHRHIAAEGPYGQVGPPSEHGSYRPGAPEGPYAQVGGGPPSEHGSYRADPYAQVGQYDRYGGGGPQDDYSRGPPDGIDPQRSEFVPPPGGVPLFPAGQASQEGMVANEPLYARVNKEKRRPEFPPDSNIDYGGQNSPQEGGGGGAPGADSWV